MALGPLGHFPALHINGLQSAAPRHSCLELCPRRRPCGELVLAPAKDAGRVAARPVTGAAPVSTRESGGRVCHACRPRVWGTSGCFSTRLHRVSSPQRLGASAARILVAFTSGPLDRGAATPRLALGRDSSRQPVRLARAYLVRVKRRLQLVPGFKLSSSFAYY